MKKKLLVIGASALLLLGAASGLASANRSFKRASAIDQDTDGYYLIKTAEDFKEVFNESAVYTTRNIRLANDINLNGYEVNARRMAGEFTATFDGNNHTISNFVVKENSSLFNLVGTNAVIKDLSISWSPRGLNAAGLSYNNNGLFDNVESTIIMDEDSVFGVFGAGGFVFAPGSGTFNQCLTNFVMNKTTDSVDTREYPAALVGNDGAGNTFTDCHYTISGTYASNNKIRKQGATLPGDYVTLDQTSMNLYVGNKQQLTADASGTVSWSSNAEGVATVSSTGLVEAVAAGEATITATCGAAQATCVVTVAEAPAVPLITLTNVDTYHGDQFCKIYWTQPADTEFSGLFESVPTKWDVTNGTDTATGLTAKGGGGSGWQIISVGTTICGKGDLNVYLHFTFYDKDNAIIGNAQYGTEPSADTISLQSTAEVKVGKTLNISAVTEAESVTWTSDDETIVTVSGTTKDATLTGVALGTTTIKAELQNGQFAECTVTVVANEAVKLSAPVGLVMNANGDGGYICAFAPVDHASGYKFEYYDVENSTASEHLVGSHTGSNGGALNPVAAGLTAGESYYVRVVAVGDGDDYTDSDPSAVVSVNDGKRKGEKTYTYHTGESYANYFLGLDMCSTNGHTMEVTETLWNQATAEYENVFVAERNNLKGKTTTAATNAISQYNYILGKYSETEFSWLKDFIGTGATRPTTSGSESKYLASNIFENSTTWIIVATSIAAISICGAALLIRRKKEQ